MSGCTVKGESEDHLRYALKLKTLPEESRPDIELTVNTFFDGEQYYRGKEIDALNIDVTNKKVDEKGYKGARLGGCKSKTTSLPFGIGGCTNTTCGLHPNYVEPEPEKKAVIFITPGGPGGLGF